MYRFARTFAVVASLISPAFAHAQTSAPLTRAQVHANLVQLEKAGYNPARNNWLYPNDLKHAEANVATQDEIKDTSYGSAQNGTAQSGK